MVGAATEPEAEGRGDFDVDAGDADAVEEGAQQKKSEIERGFPGPDLAVAAFPSTAPEQSKTEQTANQPIRCIYMPC